MKVLIYGFVFVAILIFSSAVQARQTIVVNKWNNTLKYYETGKPTREFRVATGLYKCTPEGRFRIIQKSFISRNGRGQFGTRWLGLNTLGKRGWYRIGIHGTNDPKSIGKYASKACVRMRNADVNWLFERAAYGTTVRIVDTPVKPKQKSPEEKVAKYQLQRLWLQRTVPFLLAQENSAFPKKVETLPLPFLKFIFWSKNYPALASTTFANQQSPSKSSKEHVLFRTSSSVRLSRDIQDNSTLNN